MTHQKDTAVSPAKDPDTGPNTGPANGPEIDAENDPAEMMLDAALPHVAFDGWSTETFDAAIRDSGVDPGLARALFARGSVDLARAYHARGDREMVRQLEATDLSDMRFRDRIAQAVRFRLEATGDKELVRRGMTLFSQPRYGGDGANAIWGTVDAIWTALGDTSDDVNWYTKRATLSGVYGSVVLFWLGDDSPDHQATWDFLDRRIDNVMQIEKAKAALRENKLASAILSGPLAILGQIRAPKGRGRDMPGRTG